MGILDFLQMPGVLDSFGAGSDSRPWDEVPRDSMGRPIRLPGMGAPGMPSISNQPNAQTGAMPPRGGGGWGSKIADLVSGAVAGGATPNVAGGGATDVLRAMQAAGDDSRQRSLLNYNMGRQTSQDDLHRRQVESQIKENEAQAEYRKQLGERERNRFKILPNGTVMDTYTGTVTQEAKPLAVKIQEYTEAGFTPEQARELAATGKVSPAAKPTPEPRPVLVPPGATAVDASGKVLFTAPPAQQRPLIIPRGGKAVGPDGTEIGSNPFVSTPKSGGGVPAGRKAASSATFSKIEADKQARMRRNKDIADKAVVGKTPQEIQQIRADEQAANVQAQSEYDARIAAANGSGAAPTPTGVPAARKATQPKPLDRAKAMEYLNRAGGDKAKARQMAAADGYTF